MGRRAYDIKESFYKKFKVLKNGCWKWTARIHHITHYGMFRSRHVSYLAHRISYIIHKGIIKPKKQIDHICRNRFCVNPKHLTPVTCRQNILRGNGLCAINARKKHCKRGHKFTKKNTIVGLGSWGGKYRVCRICRNLYNRLRRKSHAIKK